MSNELRDTRPRYLVWRKAEPAYNYRDGYYASEADYLSVSARLQVFIVFDRETGEETHRGCDVHFSIGGDTLGRVGGDYPELLSWIQDQIEEAIKVNLQAILEKRNIQVEG